MTVLAIAVFAVVALPRDARAHSFTFDTLPANGMLVADAGGSAGWGYTLENPSDTLWLLITDLQHDPVADGTMDVSIFDYPLLAPKQILTVPFDASAPFGLALFTWDASAPTGSINTGLFTLAAQFYTDSSLDPSSFDSDADPATAPYAIEATATATVPEPASRLIVAFAVAAIALCRLKG